MTRDVRRAERLRRVVLVCMSLLLLTALSSQQTRVRGQIKNRDGAPESQCQVDFYWGNQQDITYRVYSDQNGYFYLDDPKYGSYLVVVAQGPRTYRFSDVSVFNEGSKTLLKPDVLVVPW